MPYNKEKIRKLFNELVDELFIECECKCNCKCNDRIPTPPPPSSVSSDSSNEDELELVDKLVFGYYPEWAIYQKKFKISDIDGDKITHLLYAFMLLNPSKEDLEEQKLQFPPVPYYPQSPEGSLATHDEFAFKNNMNDLREFKKKYPKCKILMSVGGWTLSFNFSKVFGDSQLRNNFVDSVILLFKTYPFIDGIDLDWEFPNNKGSGKNMYNERDNYNFNKTLKILKEKMMMNYFNHKLITSAVGCGVNKYKEYKGLHSYLDYCLLMTYDFAGDWSEYAGHQSALYNNPNLKDNENHNVNQVVKNYIEMGYNKSQLVVGIPLYCRGWKNTKLGEKVNGKAVSIKEEGDVNLTSLKYMIGAEDWDNIAKVPTYRQGNQLWTGDNKRSIIEKCNYVKRNDLAGIMVWELSDSKLYQELKYNLMGIINNDKSYWSDKWNMPFRRIDKIRGYDIFDGTTQLRGSGYLWIEDGIMTLSGSQPRMYINIDIQDVEVSVDYMRIGDDGKGWSGCSIGVRSHPEGHSLSPEKAHTYYLRLKHGQQVDLYSEKEHSGGSRGVIHSVKYKWETEKWYNVRFVCYNMDEYKVRLEGYVNNELVIEYIDEDEKMYNAKGIVFIRNTDVKESKYKNLKIEKK